MKLSVCCLFGTAYSLYPVPSKLPPHSWDTVGNKLFIHGCKADGLFNASELALASKFALLTVEKGQGLALPGYADDKMTALAAQWKAERRAQGKSESWAFFYQNAKLDWEFYKLHAEMEAHPSWPTQRAGAVSGQPCLAKGDSSFPQPAEGMLCFNHSEPAVRRAFIASCVNATTAGGFDGCFIDSCGYARNASYPGAAPQSGYAKACDTTLAAVEAVGDGVVTMLQELQAAVGDDKLIIAKDSFGGGSEAYVNTIFPMDTFCSCYNCKDWQGERKNGAVYPVVCQTQILEAIKLGLRGQVAFLHGEVNAYLASQKNPGALLQADFEFSLAAFLVAASPSAFFAYSDGWYYNSTTWHDDYDRPLGEPVGQAKQGAGAANMTWTREFKSGTKVEVDVLGHSATIRWAK
jgi:hypothetical protein